MLEQLFPRSRLAEVLLPRTRWQPYPTASERERWEAIPEPVRSAQIKAGQKALAAEWPALPATLLLDFARTGNRSNYQEPRSERRQILTNLTAAYCMEPAEGYLDPLADAIWSICEESYWGLPAHLGMQRAGPGLVDTAEPTVDLGVGETAALMAWCHYLLGPALDEVSALLRPRMAREVRGRMMEPCLNRDDFWWMGFDAGRKVNNWNPWINSNWLTCALLLEEDEQRRLDHVEKSMRSVDLFIAGYPEDGGCDEGPGYWGRAAASLYDCLELLYSASDGAIDLYGEPLIGEMGRYIYRVHIGGQWFVNFADAAPLCMPDPCLVFNYGKRIGDSDMQAFGAFLADMAGMKAGGSLLRRLPAFFSIREVSETPSRQPLPRDVWLPDTEIMTARCSEGSTDGFFIACKGGHNDESHNHNDVGQFVVFADGRPLLVDVGVETYRRKTFSAERYDIWTMQSCYHNLLTIDAYTQAPGRDRHAEEVCYEVQDASARLILDAAPAYPPEAGIEKLLRNIVLYREGAVELVDQWQCAFRPDTISLSLMTPCAVKIPQNGLIELTGRDLGGKHRAGEGLLYFDSELLSVEVEDIKVDDPKLAGIWGGKIFRILLHVKDAAASGKYGIRVEMANMQ